MPRSKSRLLTVVWSASLSFRSSRKVALWMSSTISGSIGGVPVPTRSHKETPSKETWTRLSSFPSMVPVLVVSSTSSRAIESKDVKLLTKSCSACSLEVLVKKDSTIQSVIVSVRRVPPWYRVSVTTCESPSLVRSWMAIWTWKGINRIRSVRTTGDEEAEPCSERLCSVCVFVSVESFRRRFRVCVFPSARETVRPAASRKTVHRNEKPKFLIVLYSVGCDGEETMIAVLWFGLVWFALLFALLFGLLFRSLFLVVA
mmetsp:Transcript_4413/g.9576  ORF Transcript_4413/g.9576 Transcript_4413/m.9576 type:complete len:258 (-) Transcript_4413:193-966(-)